MEFVLSSGELDFLLIELVDIREHFVLLLRKRVDVVDIIV